MILLPRKRNNSVSLFENPRIKGNAWTPTKAFLGEINEKLDNREAIPSLLLLFTSVFFSKSNSSTCRNP